MKKRIQDLRAAASIAQAKLKFITTSKSKRGQSVPEKAYEEFIFQPNSNKIIYTQYSNAHSQFVAISYNRIFPVLPANLLKELDNVPVDVFYYKEILKDGYNVSGEIINRYIDLLRKRNGVKILDCISQNEFIGSVELNINTDQDTFLPIETDRWILLKVSKNVVRVYDSSPYDTIGDTLIQFISNILKKAKCIQEQCPKYRYGYDSGIFLCANIELLTSGKHLLYSTGDISYLRKKIAIELLNNTIL